VRLWVLPRVLPPYVTSQGNVTATIMAEECGDVSKIITTFLLHTCRLPPWPRLCDIQAAWCCAVTAGDPPNDDKEAEWIPLTTGSVADFYIEPMLQLAGDIDVMFHRNTHLAMPRGHPPPTQLPAAFHSNVKVHEIIDSHLPSYVYLKVRYLLKQCAVGGKYNCTQYGEGHHYFTHVRKSGTATHGPATFTDNSHSDSLVLSVDNTDCVRCLSWPSQAADWPTRHRNYGWPDSATLDRVVSKQRM